MRQHSARASGLNQAPQNISLDYTPTGLQTPKEQGYSAREAHVLARGAAVIVVARGPKAAQ